MRLRIEWGGGGERRWQGTISVVPGNLVAPLPLGIEADEPGSMWIDKGALRIQSPSNRVYDGVDVTVAAPLTASVVIELGPLRTAANEAAAQPTKIVLPLAELTEEHRDNPLDQQGNRLLVRRAPGDKLRIALGRDSLVFNPAEDFEFGVQPCFPGVAAGTKLRMQTRLVATRGGRVYWSDDRELTVPEGGLLSDVPFAVKAPDTEGVYDLVVTTTRRNWSDRLALRPAADERRVQIVVISANALPDAVAGQSPPPLETLVEIDPASPGWWDRMLPAQIPLMPNWRRGPLGNGDLAPWQHSLGVFAQLGLGGREPEISWEAYPLPVSKPGQPHVLEVEYPTDVPQTLGISIVEPNAAGAVLPIGLDSGVYVPSEAAEGKPTLGKHRLVFWPRTASPLVLMTNRKHGSRAVYGKIRLLGPKATYLSSLSSLTREPAAPYHLPRAYPLTDRGAGRFIAAYYDRPLFPENFSANQAYDVWNGASGRTLDDWHTFYEGGTRLVEYLNHVGHDGLMLSVVADGSTIYPSALLAPTPRYDDGAFFSTGQDPVRKDALELIFRLFDRERLKLIPAMQFSAPLPALEALRRRGGPDAAGIELVGADGRTWLEARGARQGLAAYYNPLNPRVQQAMLDAVDELVERCEAHAAFEGLALQLSADGYAQLPGVEWALDDLTLAQFADEADVDLGRGGAGQRTQRIELVLGTHRAKWLAWRSQALAQFHLRIAAKLREARPEAKLYLVGADLLNRPEIERDLRPALPAGTTLEEALQSVGVDTSCYRSTPSVVWLRPQRLAPLGALAAQAVNLELNRSSELDHMFEACAHPGGLFFHEPLEARLASFDAKSPFRRTFTRLVAQPSPSGRYNRRRFVHALASLDEQCLFDGGWLLPLGQEDETRDFIAAYRRLPAEKFETLEGSTQPVTIRHLTIGGKKFVYFVNDSQWKATVTLSVTVPVGCSFEEFGFERRLPALQSNNSAQAWALDLAPYDVVAGAFSSGDVKLTDPKVRLPVQVPESLDLRIRDLWARAASLKDPAPLAALSNAGFEQSAPGVNPPGGWLLSQADARAEVEATQPHEGQKALKFTAPAQGASLTSAPIVTPATGRLAVAVWLRVADETQQPRLRLGVQAAGSSVRYSRYASVGAPPAAQKLRNNWAQYVFQVHDLPNDATGGINLNFEMAGAGEVWIDSIELYDLDFNDSERLELSKLLSLVEYKHKNGDYADCLRLMESYWPRFLVTHVPLSQEPLARRVPSPANPAPAPSTPPAEPTPKPGFMERMRRYLPSSWR